MKMNTSPAPLFPVWERKAELPHDSDFLMMLEEVIVKLEPEQEKRAPSFFMIGSERWVD